MNTKRILFLLGSLIFFACVFPGESPVKLYCFYTPQFKGLYEEYFLPSIQDDFEIVVKVFAEQCETGIFHSPGWDRTMLLKLKLIEEAIKENWQKVFIYSDVDIIFFRPILETLLRYLGNKDLIIQQGWPRNGICAGFFMMRGNEKTLKIVQEAYFLLYNKLAIDDQFALQEAISKSGLPSSSWALLPSEEFPNGRRVLKNYLLLKNKNYTEESEIILSNSILMFHANCCLGLSTKCHFLDKVKNNYKLENSK